MFSICNVKLYVVFILISCNKTEFIIRKHFFTRPKHVFKSQKLICIDYFRKFILALKFYNRPIIFIGTTIFNDNYTEISNLSCTKKLISKFK
jgi:hypothetical protein